MMKSKRSSGTSSNQILWIELNDIQAEVISGGRYTKYKGNKYNLKRMYYAQAYISRQSTSGSNSVVIVNGEVVKGTVVTNEAGDIFIYPSA
jgi:hypothetical protein